LQLAARSRRAQRAEPEVGGNRHGVGAEAAVRTQHGLGVSFHGVDHVAAFAVDDAESALFANLRYRLRQFRKAWRPKALEKARLRLEHRDPIGGRLHHHTAKAMEAFGVVA
jgi:hypothetical protein